MQLNNPTRGTSFYESFSDLIFGTLIIFLVVVLALMMRIRGMDAEYEQAVENEVALNLYSGSPSVTKFSFTYVWVDGEPKVAFIPRSVWQSWYLDRNENYSIIRELCTLYLEEDPGITIVSLKEFQSLDRAMSYKLFRGAPVYTEIGDVLTRIAAYAKPGELPANESWKMYQAIGGFNAGWRNEKDKITDARVLAAQKAFFNFLAGPPPALAPDDPDAYWRQYYTLYDLMRPNLKETADLPPRLVFSVNDQKQFIVGDMVLNKKRFLGLLSSISIGKGFYLEYDGPGEEDEKPPAWVIEDVLEPAGLARRIPSERTIDLLRER